MSWCSVVESAAFVACGCQSLLSSERPCAAPALRSYLCSWQHCIQHMVAGGVHLELKVKIWFDVATGPNLVLPLGLDCRRLTSALGRS
jgi:hypothetical protein